jgi:hypothetical protein
MKKGPRRLTGWKKEGPENGPFFGAAYGFFPQAGSPKTAPLFQKSHWIVKFSDRQLDFGVGAIFCTVNSLQGKKLCM